MKKLAIREFKSIKFTTKYYYLIASWITEGFIFFKAPVIFQKMFVNWICEKLNRNNYGFKEEFFRRYLNQLMNHDNIF